MKGIDAPAASDTCVTRNFGNSSNGRTRTPSRIAESVIVSETLSDVPSIVTVRSWLLMS